MSDQVDISKHLQYIDMATPIHAQFDQEIRQSLEDLKEATFTERQEYHNEDKKIWLIAK